MSFKYKNRFHLLQHKVQKCELYYKQITIINYDSSIINKFAASLTDDARVVIDDHYMFIEQATGSHWYNLVFPLVVKGLLLNGK